MSIKQLVQCQECLSLRSEDLRLIISCGHIVCKRHLEIGCCPICSAADIDCTMIDALPPDCQEYFAPLNSAIERIVSIANFQKDTFQTLITRQAREISQLQEKVTEQHRALSSVKNEIAQARQMQRDYEKVKAELAALRRDSSMEDSTTSGIQQSSRFEHSKGRVYDIPRPTSTISPIRPASKIQLLHRDPVKALERFQPASSIIAKYTGNPLQGKINDKFNQPHRFQQLNRKPSMEHSRIVSSSDKVSKPIRPTRNFLNRVSSPAYRKE